MNYLKAKAKYEALKATGTATKEQLDEALKAIDAARDKEREYKKQRKAAYRNNLMELKKVIEASNAKEKAQMLKIIASLMPSEGATSGGGSYSTIETVFGVPNPAVGTTVTYMFVGVRGPKGERLNEGETLKEFVARVGDCTFKYDANTIYELAHRLQLRGYDVVADRKACTVTLNGYPK